MNIKDIARRNLENEANNEINKIINLKEDNIEEMNIKLNEYKNYLIKYLPLKNKPVLIQQALSFTEKSRIALSKKIEELNYNSEEKQKELKEIKLKEKKEKNKKKSKKELLKQNSLKIELIEDLNEETFEEIELKINKYKEMLNNENRNNLTIKDLVKCDKAIKFLNSKLINKDLDKIIDKDNLIIEVEDNEYSDYINKYIDFLYRRQEELEKNDEINLKMISERMSKELTREKEETLNLINIYEVYNKNTFSNYLKKYA